MSKSAFISARQLCFSAAILTAFAACAAKKDGTDINPTTGSTGGGSTTGSSTPVVPTTPVGTDVDFNSNYVHTVGRANIASAGGVLLAYPGSGVQVRATSGNITFAVAPRQHGEYDRVAVTIDGNTVQSVAIIGSNQGFGPQSVTVAVPQGDHTIGVFKKTEAGDGAVLVSDIATDGQFELVNSPRRLIEVVGENAAAGYSADGPAGVTQGTGCQSDAVDAADYIANPNFENALSTFGVLAARSFNADWSIVAYTGRGLVQNFDGSLGNAMPLLWTLTDPSDYRTTVAADAQAPDVVVINLGANDINYWFQNKKTPDTAGFQKGLSDFITAIHTKYGNAKIIVSVGPTLSDYQQLANGQGLLTFARTAVKAGIAQSGVTQATYLELQANSANVSCDYYPDQQGHAAAATTLAQAITTATGWAAGSSNGTNPGLAKAGIGPKHITQTFTTLPDPIAAGNDPNVTGVALQEFPQCHICSPRPYATVSTCAAVIGESEPCQSYCHVPDTFVESYATNPPVSGNHFATPEAYLGEHMTTVPRGNLLHSMEHGAMVIAYNCPQGCTADLTAVRTWMNGYLKGSDTTNALDTNNAWIILTPDPLLTGSKFAAMSWTWLYSFDTADTAALDCFKSQHMYFGRECTATGTTARTDYVSAGCSELLDQPMASVQ